MVKRSKILALLLAGTLCYATEASAQANDESLPEMPAQETITNQEVTLTAEEGTDETEVPLTEEGTDESAALPTEEGTDESAAPPTEEGTDESEVPPTEEGTDETEVPPTEEGTDETEVPPTEEGTNETEVPPTEEGTDEIEVPPTEEGTNETEVPPTENAADENLTTTAEEDNYTGWKEENGESYYYDQGQMITDCVYKIGDKWYAFSYDGTLYRDTTVSYPDEDGNYTDYRVSEDGTLVTGWFKDEYNYWHFYSREWGYLYRDVLFEENGLQYYIDSDSYLVTSTRFSYGGTYYEADEEGVLTVIKENLADGWNEIDGDWYYYKDGEFVSDKIVPIDGYDYYFDSDGKMATGMFYYYDYESGISGAKWADENGHIQTYAGWIEEDDGVTRRYAKENGWLAENEIVNIDGYDYYFYYGCYMATGKFDYTDPESGETGYKIADENGRIISQQGWYETEYAWYYIKEGGWLASDEMLSIDGSDYYFLSGGDLARGTFYYHDPVSGQEGYKLTDDNGRLIQTEGWYETEHAWYYIKEGGWLAYDEILSIDGSDYYFYSGGILARGTFYYHDPVSGQEGYKLADDNGRLIQTEGWYEKTEYDWYYIKEGSWLAADEFLTINGSEYYFYSDGIMAKNCFSYYDSESGETIYKLADEAGHIINGDGWYQMNNDWYYFKEYGRLAADEFLTIDNFEYYFTAGGYMATGSFYYHDSESDREGFKLADQNGHLIKNQGWYQHYHDWYYVKGDGWLVSDEILEIGGSEYYFYYSGYMATGAFYYQDGESGEEGYRLADENGRIIVREKGWYQRNDDWYYFQDEKYIACSGLYNIGGSDYYFYGNGVMATGYFTMYDSEEEREKEYIADQNGVVFHGVSEGWFQVPGSQNWYYYKEPYDLAVDEFLTIADKRYYFNWEAAMATQKFWHDEKYYMPDSSGALQKNQWINESGQWYYTKDDYSLCTDGVFEISGRHYIFSYGGQMMTGFVGLYDPDESKTHYYLTDESGAVLEGEGWKQYNLSWYYSDVAGKLYTSQWIDNTFYVDSVGRMVVGSMYVDGKLYQFDNNGYYQDDLSPDFTGWRLADGTWYYNDENGKPYTGWVDGNYFVAGGRMLTNDMITDPETGNRYYLQHDGKYIRNGWYFRKNDLYGYGDLWVYANADGTLVTNGWKSIDGKWYYFEEGRLVCSGIRNIDGKWECFAEDGTWLGNGFTGWQKLGENWYYFYPDGELLRETETAVIDGRTFYFYYDGSLRCNEVYVDKSGKAVYLDENGYSSEIYGWYRDRYNDWYYINSDGTPATGLKQIGGSWYLFSEYGNGRMMTGNQWVEEWGGYYFFGENGWQEVSDGWNFDGNNWYYYVNGNAIEDTIYNINGKDYYLTYHGAMVTGMYDGWVFADSGALLRNAWYYDDRIDAWFYADANGRAVSGEYVIDGTTYWFDYDGILIK